MILVEPQVINRLTWTWTMTDSATASFMEIIGVIAFGKSDVDLSCVHALEEMRFTGQPLRYTKYV